MNYYYHCVVVSMASNLPCILSTTDVYYTITIEFRSGYYLNINKIIIVCYILERVCPLLSITFRVSTKAGV